MLALKLNVESCKECPFNHARPSCGTKGTEGIKFCHAIWAYVQEKNGIWVPTDQKHADGVAVWDPDNGWLRMSSDLAGYLIPTNKIAPGERDP
jgi:hypothetical protein